MKVIESVRIRGCVLTAVLFQVWIQEFCRARGVAGTGGVAVSAVNGFTKKPAKIKL